MIKQANQYHEFAGGAWNLSIHLPMFAVPMLVCWLAGLDTCWPKAQLLNILHNCPEFLDPTAHQMSPRMNGMYSPRFYG